MSLVSLQLAKQQAGITINDDDELIQTHLEMAEAFVLKYLERPTDTTWTATVATWTELTVPLPVMAAILRLFLNLHRDRGDEMNIRRDTVDGIPAEVAFLLRPYRDHVLA